MCGIFGCVGKINRDKVKTCIKKIQHRGPDALGIEELQGATLAHARLSIIDISNFANQPFSSIDKRYWLIFNGEIYNFIELKKELEFLGYVFHTESDTEVVLYAYLHWGEAFQKKCNGMWALAIWDDYEKSLFISRDRLGVKPLYWYKDANNFYIASEMKAFFPIMEEIIPNQELFLPYKAFGYESTENCVIRNINRLQPGHCAIYKEKKIKIKKWWSTLDNLIEVPKNYKEQVECLRALFLDAVKIRMRSDVPIGTALSGGLDSSSIVGVMHYLSQKENSSHFCTEWQNAFVASMPGTINDETQYAEMAAEYIGIDVKKVMIRAPKSEEELMKYVYMSDEPYDTALIPHFQEYRAIRDGGIKVTVDGVGADELFGGYQFDLLQAIQKCSCSDKELIDLIQVHNDITLKEFHVTLEEIMDSRKMSQTVNRENFISNIKNMDFLNKILYKETHEQILPTILRVTDRYGMASGVEIRMPFLDYRIVNFAFSLPWTSKIRNGYSKAIERDMARPYMTNKILNRKLKIGFNDPLTEWFRGPLREFLLDTIHSRDFIECNLVNSLETTVIVHEFLKNTNITYQGGHEIWSLIVPYLWKKVMLS